MYLVDICKEDDEKFVMCCRERIAFMLFSNYFY